MNVSGYDSKAILDVHVTHLVRDWLQIQNELLHKSRQFCNQVVGSPSSPATTSKLLLQRRISQQTIKCQHNLIGGRKSTCAIFIFVTIKALIEQVVQ